MIVNKTLGSLKNDTDKWMISFFIIFIFLPGTFSIGPISYPILCTIILAFFAFIKRAEILKNLHMHCYYLFGTVLLGMVMLLLTIFNLLRLDIAFHVNILFDPIKIIFYGLEVILLIQLLKRGENFTYALKFACIAITVASIIGILQYYDPFSWNEKYLHIYTPNYAYRLYPESLSKRIVGTKTNPNLFGTLLSFSFLLDLLYLKICKNKKLFTTMVCIKAFALMLTFSRTAMAASVGSIFVFIFINTILTKGWKTTFKHIVIFLIFGVILLIVLPNKLTYRFTELLHISNLESWMGRVDNWEEIIVIVEQNFILGIGPVKNFFNAVDSEWMQVLLEYGCIGMVSYLIFIINPFIVIFKKYKKQNSFMISCYAYIIIAIGLNNIANISIWSVQISYFVFFLVGMTLSLDNMVVSFNADFIMQKQNNGKKRILILSPYFPPCGGIGVFRITKFVKYLYKFDYEPYVVTFHKKHYTSIDESLLENFKRDLKIYHITKEKSFLNDDGLQFYKALLNSIDDIVLDCKPDIVLATGGPFLYLPITRKIKNKYRIPYVIDLRDPWSLELRKASKFNLSGMKKQIYDAISNMAERYTLKDAGAVITVNETMNKDYQRKYKKICNKFNFITNGFDPSDFEDIHPYPFERFTVLYSGKFQSNGLDYLHQSNHFRNPYVVLKAISELNINGFDIQFVHVGKEEVVIRRMVEDLDLVNKCIFTGFVSYKETLQYCKGANILLLIGGEAKYEQTGKVFDYLGVNRDVLCLCKKESEINTVAKTSGQIHQFDLDANVETLKTFIIKMHNKSEIVENSNDIFTRYELTRQLSSILDNILSISEVE